MNQDMKQNIRLITGLVLVIMVSLHGHACRDDHEWINGPLSVDDIPKIWTRPYWTEIIPATPDKPSERIFYMTGYDRIRQKMVLFGGSRGAGNPVFFDDTWEFDGSQWDRVYPEISPAKRARAGFCYVPTWQCFIMYGGLSLDINGNWVYYDETWKYQNGVWELLAPNTNPGARYSCGMTFDAHVGKILMFAGRGINTDFGDFWSFDGTTWTKIGDFESTLGHPSDPLMAYDESRQVTVMTQGWYGSSNRNYTWEYDGTTWTLINTLNRVLPLRRLSAFCYDPVRKKCVLFGGSSLSPYNFFNDTWEYDGIDWQKIKPGGTTPPKRTYARFCYMENLRACILFGGNYVNDAQNDTWKYSSFVFKVPPEQYDVEPPDE